MCSGVRKKFSGFTRGVCFKLNLPTVGFLTGSQFFSELIRVIPATPQIQKQINLV